MQNSKVLADAVESILGAFYIGCGEESTLGAMSSMGIIPCSKFEPLKTLTNNDGVITNGNRAAGLEAIEEMLGYKFKHPSILEEALTHGSCLGGSTCSYQRLEFLGDAILDVCLTLHMYNTYQ